MAAPVEFPPDTAAQAPAHPHAPNGNGINGTATTIATTNGAEETTAMPGLSAEEMAQYDRQIRLWGAEAQQRIRSANILLISLRALGTEIAKNLTLAGVQSLTIIDDELIVEEDLGAQFFIREEDIGKPVSFPPSPSSTPITTNV
jgi:ubiquitin-like 1-activating enzyme E1 A